MKTLVVLLASRSHASTILAVVLCDTTVVSFQSIALSGSPLNQRPEHRSSLSLSISYSSNQKTQKSCSSRTLRPLFILPLSLSLCVSLSIQVCDKVTFSSSLSVHSDSHLLSGSLLSKHIFPWTDREIWLHVTVLVKHYLRRRKTSVEHGGLADLARPCTVIYCSCGGRWTGNEEIRMTRGLHGSTSRGSLKDSSNLSAPAGVSQLFLYPTQFPSVVFVLPLSQWARCFCWSWGNQ